MQCNPPMQAFPMAPARTPSYTRGSGPFCHTTDLSFVPVRCCDPALRSGWGSPFCHTTDRFLSVCSVVIPFLGGWCGNPAELIGKVPCTQALSSLEMWQKSHQSAHKLPKKVLKKLTGKSENVSNSTTCAKAAGHRSICSVSPYSVRLSSQALFAMIAVYAYSIEFHAVQREVKNGMVSPFAYLIANGLLQLPFMFLFSLCSLGLPAYVIAGFNFPNCGLLGALFRR